MNFMHATRPVSLLIVTSLFLVSACAAPGSTQPQGPTVEQRYDLDAISRASFSGRAELHLVPSNETALVISAARNIIEALDVEVRGRHLSVEPKAGVQLSRSASPVYTLYVDRLQRLDLDGAVALSGEQRGSGDFSIHVSGSVSGELAVTVPSLNVASSGSVELSLSGQTDHLDIDSSGSVRLDATNLLARTAQLDSSGASHLDIWVEDNLDISSSGATRVRYRGQPRINQNTSGASSITALDD